ncbi:transglutaminase domain-containing protein [Blautia wexlerae]|uniref:transglutaminase domain-containing protein n=1 Tax=Blautia wexlerae TaxID=418240 RepID=UPI0031B60A8F
MNKKKITALLLSSVMALTPAMPAMAEQSTIVNYVDGTTDSTVETPDVTPTPLPEKKEGWETVDGVKYYYVNGEKITNKVKKIGKYTYCFDKTGKLVTNKPYYKVNSKTYYKIKKNGQATKLSTVETMAAVRLQKCKGNLKKAFNWSVSQQYAGNVKVSKKTPTEYGLYGFKTGSGDCYVMAATFYWMAKVAGYDAHYVKGYFQKSGGKKGAHAWVEIDQKVNGKKKTYVYDPNFQKEYKLNGYKLTYGAKRTLKYVNYKRVN